tara:strand:- start:675 stop:1796 length:1122 start_codon:yes stop_codon:yes gene_type:complete
MKKRYVSLGLMSGTSGDGVDTSIIISNGLNEYESVEDKYFEYDKNIYKKYIFLREKIYNSNDLERYKSELLNLERQITIFHAKIIKDLKIPSEDIIIGFHGQTIYHNSKENISYQLGDGQLLSQLVQKKIIFNFRKNDILNGGEGAPLTPIFHQLIASQNELLTPVCFLNIGGISNVTIVKGLKNPNEIQSKDLGPGNCLIDGWIRKNSNKKFDKDGHIASQGKINEIILEQAQELYVNRINKKKLSYDINDFDISFARGLTLEDGALTLTEFTANLLSIELSDYISNLNLSLNSIFLCGGGRKNKVLVEKIKQNFNTSTKLKSIDELKINGDFVESQAFAFLAIRSFKNLPITFPNTTGCNVPCTGGELIEI